MKHLKYLRYLLKHKWWVFYYALKLSWKWMWPYLVFRGLIHDWSKFRPSEWMPYANFFYGAGNSIKRNRDATGYYKPTDTGDVAFDRAWLFHQNRNKHHWQYWMLNNDDGTTKAFEMPLIYALEMYCDWKGAGRAQGNVYADGTPKVDVWYWTNKDKMTLHPSTRKLIESMLLKEYPKVAD